MQRNVCGEEMHLGQTEPGAAAHFPQATSEGNPPPGPPSVATPRLQAQGRAVQVMPGKPHMPTNTDTICQQAGRAENAVHGKDQRATRSPAHNTKG